MALSSFAVVVATPLHLEALANYACIPFTVSDTSQFSCFLLFVLLYCIRSFDFK